MVYTRLGNVQSVVCAEIPCQGSANRPGANQGAWTETFIVLGKNPIFWALQKGHLHWAPLQSEVQGNIAWTLLRSDMGSVPLSSGVPTILWGNSFFPWAEP